LYKWNAELTGSKATDIYFLYSYKRDAVLPVCACARLSASGTRGHLYIGLSSAAVVLSLAFYGVV